MISNNYALAVISLILTPAISYGFMCPTNFNQIEVSNTIDQVKAQCGKPDKEESKEVTAEGPQEWSYFVPQSISTPAMQPMQGTLKTSIAFDKDGKVINISVNGIGVGSTQLCGSTVSLGNSRDSVKASCGDPSYIAKEQPKSATPPETTKVTTFTYNTNPPSKLIFENGKLKEKQ